MLRRRASVCCRRIASVIASKPGTLRFCSSSTKPRRERPSTSSGFWFRNEPPPNSLISRRCSDLVNSSQSGVSGILVLPSDSLRRTRFDTNVNQRLTEMAPVHRQRAAMGRTTYAANAFRTAFDSICSAANVNRVPLTSPMRRKVSRATGSQRSVEAPSANIARARCSSESRSVHEIPSIAHLGSSRNAKPNDRTEDVKVLLKFCKWAEAPRAVCHPKILFGERTSSPAHGGCECY